MQPNSNENDLENVSPNNALPRRRESHLPVFKKSSPGSLTVSKEHRRLSNTSSKNAFQKKVLIEEVRIFTGLASPLKVRRLPIPATPVLFSLTPAKNITNRVSDADQGEESTVVVVGDNAFLREIVDDITPPQDNQDQDHDQDEVLNTFTPMKNEEKLDELELEMRALDALDDQMLISETTNTATVAVEDLFNGDGVVAVNTAEVATSDITNDLSAFKSSTELSSVVGPIESAQTTAAAAIESNKPPVEPKTKAAKRAPRRSFVASVVKLFLLSAVVGFTVFTVFEHQNPTEALVWKENVTNTYVNPSVDTVLVWKEIALNTYVNPSVDTVLVWKDAAFDTCVKIFKPSDDTVSFFEDVYSMFQSAVHWAVDDGSAKEAEAAVADEQDIVSPGSVVEQDIVSSGSVADEQDIVSPGSVVEQDIVSPGSVADEQDIVSPGSVVEQDIVSPGSSSSVVEEVVLAEPSDAAAAAAPADDAGDADAPIIVTDFPEKKGEEEAGVSEESVSPTSVEEEGEEYVETELDLSAAAVSQEKERGEGDNGIVPEVEVEDAYVPTSPPTTIEEVEVEELEVEEVEAEVEVEQQLADQEVEDAVASISATDDIDIVVAAVDETPTAVVEEEEEGGASDSDAVHYEEQEEEEKEVEQISKEELQEGLPAVQDETDAVDNESPAAAAAVEVEEKEQLEIVAATSAVEEPVLSSSTTAVAIVVQVVHDEDDDITATGSPVTDDEAAADEGVTTTPDVIIVLDTDTDDHIDGDLEEESSVSGASSSSSSSIESLLEDAQQENDQQIVIAKNDIQASIEGFAAAVAELTNSLTVIAQQSEELFIDALTKEAALAARAPAPTPVPVFDMGIVVYSTVLDILDEAMTTVNVVDVFGFIYAAVAVAMFVLYGVPSITSLMRTIPAEEISSSSSESLAAAAVAAVAVAPAPLLRTISNSSSDSVESELASEESAAGSVQQQDFASNFISEHSYLASPLASLSSPNARRAPTTRGSVRSDSNSNSSSSGMIYDAVLSTVARIASASKAAIQRDSAVVDVTLVEVEAVEEEGEEAPSAAVQPAAKTSSRRKVGTRSSAAALATEAASISISMEAGAVRRSVRSRRSTAIA